MCDNQGWEKPIVEEFYNPDRTRLSLTFTEKQADKTSGQNKRIEQAYRTSEQSKRRKTEENYSLIKNIWLKTDFLKPVILQDI